MTPIKFQRLHPDAKLPTYGSTGAACFDLYAVEDVSGRYRAVVCTGLAVELPPGKEMVIRSRSGLAFNRGLHAFHGTIDADYRGEIKVLLTAEDMLPFEIKAGERIAQAKVQDAPQYHLEWADDLSATARGVSGFGSSGA